MLNDDFTPEEWEIIWDTIKDRNLFMLDIGDYGLMGINKGVEE